MKKHYAHHSQVMSLSYFVIMDATSTLEGLKSIDYVRADMSKMSVSINRLSHKIVVFDRQKYYQPK